jgi:hypothetical protein
MVIAPAKDSFVLAPNVSGIAFSKIRSKPVAIRPMLGTASAV